MNIHLKGPFFLTQALLPLLADADKAIPLKAVDALGKLGADAASVAVPALLPLLKEHLSVVRLHLIRL